MSNYTHTLIPSAADFVPEPEQVRGFLAALSDLGTLPREPRWTLATPSGEARTFLNPFTMQTESREISKVTKLRGLAGLKRAALEQPKYRVTAMGMGPPTCPPIEFDLKKYEFGWACVLESEIVSTSDWHDPEDDKPITKLPLPAKKPRIPQFGTPCSSQDQMGHFTHWDTGKTIKVKNAGCARFRVEIEFGKFMFPKVNKNFDLLEASLLAAINDAFGVEFAQGCWWCL